MTICPLFCFVVETDTTFHTWLSVEDGKGRGIDIPVNLELA